VIRQCPRLSVSQWLTLKFQVERIRFPQAPMKRTETFVLDRVSPRQT
jgi:hypothetical protein